VYPPSLMGVTMRLSLAQVGEETAKFTGPEVELIARDTGFVQRTSSLTGQAFVQALTFGFLERQVLSLNDLAQICADLGIEITAQGLDQRITDKSVAFLKAMFARAMDLFKNRIPLPLAILQQFKGVYLTDSSVIPLPDSLAQDYPGCGGNGPRASVKVQLVFDLLHGNLVQVALQAGREPDQNYRDYTQVIPEGALSITDLGYFVLDGLQTIMCERRAYFLCRFQPRTGLLTPAGAPIDLRARLEEGCQGPVEFPVLLGKQAKHRLPCRLMALPVPQEVADQRRHKAKEKARRQHKTAGKETLALMGWTIFVTNVPVEMLSIEHIAVLYQVRWQIELVFKLWKSHCGLRHVAGFRRERILVELYGKLIGVVLTHFLIAPLRMPEGPWTNREISPVQVRKIFQRFARNLNRCLSHAARFQELLADMLSHIERFGFKQKRKKRPNTCHALALVSAIYQVTVDLNQGLFLA
jgi:hypothetical protein